VLKTDICGIFSIVPMQPLSEKCFRGAKINLKFISSISGQVRIIGLVNMTDEPWTQNHPIHSHSKYFVKDFNVRIKMHNLIPVLLIMILMFSGIFAAELDTDIEKQITNIILRMTLAEKANMLGGDTTAFDSKPLARLGIPALRMTDGPNGVRWGKSTAFPVGVCIAATWDTSLVYQLAQALGRETKAQGRNVLLGPCVNIHRDAHAGRNFESYGEDPYLAARIAVAFVKGLQSEKVIATTKHFACNNQEFERMSMDTKIDERTIREIYFPAFKAAVQEGNTWSIMSAYNRLNGHYASSNTWLLNTVLKEEWGFKGFVMSDWGAVHSVVPTMYAGLDIEMPNGRYMNVKNVVQAIYEGRMKESKVDDKVRRMLRAMFAMNLMEQEIPEGAELHSPAHLTLAKKVAESGIVLLKNDGDLLPLTAAKFKSIAVIGPNAAILRTGGGGSSKIDPIEAKSPLAALTEKAKNIKISYSPGMLVAGDLKPIPGEYLETNDGLSGIWGEYFDNSEFDGEPIEKRVDINIDFYWGNKGPIKKQADYFSIRWTGKLKAPETGRYILATTSDDGSRLYLNGSLVIDNWGDHAMETQTTMVDLIADSWVDIRIEFYEHGGDAGIKLQWQKMTESLLEKAVQIARESDAVVMFMGFSDRDESEGHDRESNAFPEQQIELIEKVTTVNKNVVVVFNSGAAVQMSAWEKQIPAIVESWYSGEQGGNAIADILLGNINPSGKLVTTFFRDEKDSPTFANYPGEDDELHYEEGLFVGYRHYDKMDIDPLFPFGHGLSYTDFEYSDLNIAHRTVKQGEAVNVSLKIKNTGNRAGAEVVQLYLQDNKASVVRPEQELKSFYKVYLEPGEVELVALKMGPEALKYWDIETATWKAEAGEFTVRLGASSRDIRLQGRFKLK